MMIKQHLLLLSCFLFVALLSPAQQGNRQLLNRQLAAYHTSITQLYQTRSMTPWFLENNVSAYVLQEALESYPQVRLLFYHHQHDSLWVWLIGADSIQGAPAGAVTPAQLKSLEAELKQHIVGGKEATRGGEVQSTVAKKSFAETNQALSALLFPAAIREKLLRLAADSAANLVVIPALNIASLPLYALQPFGDGTHLIEKACLAFAPSFADLLKRIYQYRSPEGYAFGRDTVYEPLNLHLETEADSYRFRPPHALVVGNPDFTACAGFSPLQGAGQEARFAASALKTMPLTGRAATKMQVLEKLANSSLLYFATHGIADTVDALNRSYLLLSGKNGCEKWTSKEIQHTRFNGDALVVLSACETGVGRSMTAGIIGLARAFLLGGAANVVMSLWKVDDNATMRLMQGFVQAMMEKKEGFFPAAHLRSAILQYKKSDSRLSAWGAFTVMGVPLPADKKIVLGTQVNGKE